MDHEGEDSGFNLYEDYGADMADDGDGGDDAVAVIDDTTYPMHGWDHHASAPEGAGVGVYPDLVDAGGFDHHDTKMDFDARGYGHDFHQNQHFDGGDPTQEFSDYMVQEIGGDQHEQDHHNHHQHQHQQGDDSGYDISSMELYHTPTIYPNLTQTQDSQQQYGNLTQLYRTQQLFWGFFDCRSDIL